MRPQRDGNNRINKQRKEMKKSCREKKQLPGINNMVKSEKRCQRKAVKIAQKKGGKAQQQWLMGLARRFVHLVRFRFRLQFECKCHPASLAFFRLPVGGGRVLGS